MSIQKTSSRSFSPLLNAVNAEKILSCKAADERVERYKALDALRQRQKSATWAVPESTSKHTGSHRLVKTRCKCEHIYEEMSESLYRRFKNRQVSFVKVYPPRRGSQRTSAFGRSFCPSYLSWENNILRKGQTLIQYILQHLFGIPGLGANPLKRAVGITRTPNNPKNF